MRKIYSILVGALLTLLWAGQVNAQTIVYVSPDGAGAKDGTSWADALPLGGLNKITITGDDQEYRLLGGTYAAPDATVADGTADYILINFSGGAKATPQKNIKVLGGYTGVGENRVLGSTIINGADFATVGTKAIRGISTGVSLNVLISGITFQGFSHKSMGGAIFVRSGGVDGYNDGTVIEDCVFKNNDLSLTTQTSTGGGSIFISTNTTGTDQYVTIRRNVFEGNISRTTTDGTIGIGNANTNQKAFVQITGNTFKNNAGGAIASRQLAAGGDVTIANNLFVDNTNSAGTAADINLAHASITGYIYNNTFVGSGVGVNAVAGISYNLVNNIFVGKSYTGTPTTFLNNIAETAPSVGYSFGNIPVAVPQTTLDAYVSGNITGTADPSVIFTDVATGDYTLKAGSPALGAGVSSSDIGYTGNATTAAAALTSLPAITGETEYFYIYFSYRNGAFDGTSYKNINQLVATTGTGTGIGSYAGGLLTDKGDGVKLAVLGIDANPATQRWKAKLTADGYRLYSELGNSMIYDGSEYASSSTSGVVFAPELRKATEYILKDVTNNTYFNRRNNNDGVTNYSAEDAGNTEFLTGFPEWIAGELDYTGSTWYRIYTSRRFTEDKPLTANELDSIVTQTVASPNASQLWSLSGSDAAVTVSAYNGSQMKFNGDNTVAYGGLRMITATTGDVFGTVYKGVSAFGFKNVSNPSNNASYNNWNDNSGTQIGYWTQADGGSMFTFVKVPATAATVSTGTNVNNASIVLPAGATLGTQFSIPKTGYAEVQYEVTAGYAPIVKINGELSAVGTLSGNVYTLQAVVTDTSTITISADLAQTVTVTTGLGISSLTSPSLDSNNQYTSPSETVLTFTLAHGYENPTVTVNGAAGPTPELIADDEYKVSITGISAATAITISSSPIQFPFTATAVGATYTSTIPTAIEFQQPLTVTFTLNEGYHLPKISVNGEAVDATETSGTYSFTITSEDTTSISVYAFKNNIIPVSEDTWISHKPAEATNNYYLNPTLTAAAKNISTTYNSGRAFVRFDLSSVNLSAYDKAMLKVILTTNNKSFERHLGVYTVESEVTSQGGLDTLVWENSGTPAGGINGTLIAQGPTNFARAAIANSPYLTATGVVTDYPESVDLTDYIKAYTGTDLYLQLVEESAQTGDGGILTIKSLENGDLSLIPVLFFPNKYDVTVTSGTGITDLTAPATAYESEDLVVTFKLDAGYHTPYAKAGATALTVTDDGAGLYTVTIPSIAADADLVIGAYSANEIFASADTYVNGRAATTNSSAETVLLVQDGSTSYERRAYIQFDLTSKPATYNKVELQLVSAGASLNANGTQNGLYQVAANTVPATLPEISDMTWTANAESETAPFGTLIGLSDTVTLAVGGNTMPDGDIVKVDVSAADLTADSIRFLVISAIPEGYTKAFEGQLRFYSVESDVANRPLLIFSNIPTYTITTTLTGATLTTGTASASVKEGESYTLTFTINANYENPSVTIDGAPYTLAAPVSGVYTVTIDNVTANTVISIEAIPSGLTTVGDAIVGTQYYNLQGVRIDRPTVKSGAYIVKTIRQSGKIDTRVVVE
ncbi:MAG: DNRLRE domain-containing protein [Candidatus Symbiothrix sp.]|jgi:hypothetical protein|nr:DNRLRE domain-containing protein [Candidatus Symbiothrix sp.]